VPPCTGPPRAEIGGSRPGDLSPSNTGLNGVRPQGPESGARGKTCLWPGSIPACARGGRNPPRCHRRPACEGSPGFDAVPDRSQPSHDLRAGCRQAHGSRRRRDPNLKKPSWSRVRVRRTAPAVACTRPRAAAGPAIIAATSHVTASGHNCSTEPVARPWGAVSTTRRRVACSLLPRRGCAPGSLPGASVGFFPAR
jgi:hypothetical protein